MATFKIMSFNLRVISAEDGAQAWRKRRHLALARINAFYPHLLGLQECMAGEQADFIASSMPDYAMLAHPRGGSHHTAIEMAPVLYKRDAFMPIEDGVFWLSDAPDVPGSQSWGAVFPRTCTWVRLKPRQKPQAEILFLNTHFDHLSEAVMQNSAQLIQQFINAQAETTNIVLTGDFNCPRGSSPWRILTAAGNRLHDAFPRTSPGSYHEFGQLNPPKTIDWILLSNQCVVAQTGVDDYNDAGLFPSDHFPVHAEVVL